MVKKKANIKKKVEVVEEVEVASVSSENISRKLSKRINFNWIFYPLFYAIILSFAIVKTMNYIEDYKEKAEVGLEIQKEFTLEAKFFDVSGLEIGTPVVIAGIEVGSVKSIVINEDFFVDVVFAFNSVMEIPSDSFVRILTLGVFGEKFVSIEMGDFDEYLENGDAFEFVEDSVDTQGLMVVAVRKFMKKAGVEIEDKKESSVEKIRDDLRRILEDVERLDSKK